MMVLSISLILIFAPVILWMQLRFDIRPFDLLWHWLTGPRRRARQLCARADAQHTALLAGDDTAIFRRLPPTVID